MCAANFSSPVDATEGHRDSQHLFQPFCEYCMTNTHLQRFKKYNTASNLRQQQTIDSNQDQSCLHSFATSTQDQRYQLHSLATKSNQRYQPSMTNNEDQHFVQPGMAINREQYCGHHSRARNPDQRCKQPSTLSHRGQCWVPRSMICDQEKCCQELITFDSLNQCCMKHVMAIHQANHSPQHASRNQDKCSLHTSLANSRYLCSQPQTMHSNQRQCCQGQSTTFSRDSRCVHQTIPSEKDQELLQPDLASNKALCRRHQNMASQHLLLQHRTTSNLDQGGQHQNIVSNREWWCCHQPRTGDSQELTCQQQCRVSKLDQGDRPEKIKVSRDHPCQQQSSARNRDQCCQSIATTKPQLTNEASAASMKAWPVGRTSSSNTGPWQTKGLLTKAWAFSGNSATPNACPTNGSRAAITRAYPEALTSTDCVSAWPAKGTGMLDNCCQHLCVADKESSCCQKQCATSDAVSRAWPVTGSRSASTQRWYRASTLEQTCQYRTVGRKWNECCQHHSMYGNGDHQYLQQGLSCNRCQLYHEQGILKGSSSRLWPTNKSSTVRIKSLPVIPELVYCVQSEKEPQPGRALPAPEQSKERPSVLPSEQCPLCQHRSKADFHSKQ